MITNQAYELARAFNDFYTQCPMWAWKNLSALNADPSCGSLEQAIANSLALLGITASGDMKNHLITKGVRIT